MRGGWWSAFWLAPVWCIAPASAVRAEAPEWQHVAIAEGIDFALPASFVRVSAETDAPVQLYHEGADDSLEVFVTHADQRDSIIAPHRLPTASGPLPRESAERVAAVIVAALEDEMGHPGLPHETEAFAFDAERHALQVQVTAHARSLAASMVRQPASSRSWQAAVASGMRSDVVRCLLEQLLGDRDRATPEQLRGRYSLASAECEVGQGQVAYFAETVPGPLAFVGRTLISRMVVVVSERGTSLVRVTSAEPRRDDVATLTSIVWESLEVAAEARIEPSLWSRLVDAIAMVPNDAPQRTPDQVRTRMQRKMNLLGKVVTTYAVFTVILFAVLARLLAALGVRSPVRYAFGALGLCALVAYKAFEHGVLSSGYLPGFATFLVTAPLAYLPVKSWVEKASARAASRPRSSP